MDSRREHAEAGSAPGRSSPATCGSRLRGGDECDVWLTAWRTVPAELDQKARLDYSESLYPWHLHFHERETLGMIANKDYDSNPLRQRLKMRAGSGSLPTRLTGAASQPKMNNSAGVIASARRPNEPTLSWLTSATWSSATASYFVSTKPRSISPAS